MHFGRIKPYRRQTPGRHNTTQPIQRNFTIFLFPLFSSYFSSESRLGTLCAHCIVHTQRKHSAEIECERVCACVRECAQKFRVHRYTHPSTATIQNVRFKLVYRRYFRYCRIKIYHFIAGWSAARFCCGTIWVIVLIVRTVRAIWDVECHSYLYTFRL